jgi:NTP pyrophosphatase (non-canonical NTP hydrolase)
MELNEYQKKALPTEVRKDGDENDRKIIFLLGIAGEAGTLLSEHKKQMVTAQNYTIFKNIVKEEIGDILWYLSNLASIYKITLEDVASYNLEKTEKRYNKIPEKEAKDIIEKESEKIPDTLSIKFVPDLIGETPTVSIFIPGHDELGDIKFGDDLDDNSHNEDFYRYHDAFHFAFATVLNWSPAFRALLKRKRKSNPDIDRIEDGARAFVVEEAIVAIIFNELSAYDFKVSKGDISYKLLKTIKQLTKNLEVNKKEYGEWEDAIILGCNAFLALRNNNGGILVLNKIKKTLDFKPLDYDTDKK